MISEGGDSEDEDDEDEDDDDDDGNGSDKNNEAETSESVLEQRASLRASAAAAAAATMAAPNFLPTVAAPQAKSNSFMTRLRQSVITPLFRAIPSAVTAPELISTYSCNFGKSVVFVPGCHGNCVMKFDFIDAE